MIEHTPISAISLGWFILVPFYIISFFAFIVASIFIFHFIQNKKKFENSFMLELLMVTIVFGMVFTLLIPRALHANFSSLRGLIVVTLFVFFYVMIRKKSFSYIDVIALATPLFLAIARLACFIEWHCYGIFTNLPWGVSVNGGLPVHPTQIYLSLINLSLFFILYNIRNFNFFNQMPGNMVFTYLASYSFLRLTLVEPLRYGVGTPDGFLRSSLLMLIFIASFMIILIRNRDFYVKNHFIRKI